MVLEGVYSGQPRVPADAGGGLGTVRFDGAKNFGGAIALVKLEGDKVSQRHGGVKKGEEVGAG